MSEEELKREAEKMMAVLKQPLSSDMQSVVDFGDILRSWQSLSGEMLAQAKYYYNRKKHDGAMEVIDRLLKNEKIAASTQKALIDTMCANEQYLVDLIERMNASIVHQIDWCRTLVSKNKEEMKFTNMGKEFQ